MASAPAASARRASSTAWLVAFDIAPAMTRDAAAGDVDRGANDELLLGGRECRRLAGRLADHERGNAGRDLALAERGERLEIDCVRRIERRRHVRDEAGEPG